jgi:NDP-sugar pyrophosphorylase family protein
LDAFISARVGSVEKWKISADGTAVFREIYADNCRIGNSVLETGSIQSVGNLMIFNDSYLVKESYADGSVLLENAQSLRAGDYVIINKNYYKVDSIVDEGNYKKVGFNEVVSGNISRG